MVKRHWNEEELEAHWLLTAEERTLMAGRTDHGRLGFAVMLKFGPSAFSVQMVAPALTGVRRPHDGY
jgi:hypothetical protein